MLDPRVPASLSDEQQLLAQVVFQPALLPSVQPLIRDADVFYYKPHRWIWTAILSLTFEDQPINLSSVAAWLEARDLLDKEVDRAVFREMAEDVLLPVDPVTLAQRLLDLYCRRKLGDAARVLTRLMGDLKTPLPELRRQAEEAVFEATSTEDASELRPIGDVLRQSFDAYERRRQNRDILMVPTGLFDLDALLGGGLRLGTLTTIIGRPAMGKTAALMTLACNIAKHHAVAIFSLEMTQEQLVERLLLGSGVSAERWRNGKELTPLEMERLQAAFQKYKQLPIFLDDTPGLTPIEIGMKLRRLISRLAVSQQRLRVVFIDYLQLMVQGGESSEVVLEISKTTKALCALAKKLNLAVVLLSQINRAKEHQSDKRPGLGDARGSGAIEEDSAVVIGLYREEYYNPNASPEAEWLVLKNRFGKTGVVKLLFDKERSEFKNIALR